MKTQTIIIAILSIVCISFGISYFKIKEEMSLLDDDKNFRSEWNQTGQDLIVYWKKNNKLAQLHVDRNFDNNFEISNAYNVVGQLMMTSYDANEDGVYERGKSFNLHGEAVGTYADLDEDGALDKFSLTLDNGNEIEFIDNDLDGRYERVIIKDSLKTSELAIEDFFKSK